jgi:hypothetical protein
MALIIEASVSIYLYALLALTDFMGENALREELGWLLSILTGTIVAINFSVFLWNTSCKAVAFIRRRVACLFNLKARVSKYTESQENPAPLLIENGVNHQQQKSHHATLKPAPYGDTLFRSQF